MYYAGILLQTLGIIGVAISINSQLTNYLGLIIGCSLYIFGTAIKDEYKDE